MNELGLTLDGPKPLKGMLNVLGSNAAVPEGGEKFATVLENRVQANLSQAEVTEDGAEPVITQPAAKLSWTPMSDETEETGIITNQPLDPIVAAKIPAEPSSQNVEKAATQEATYLDAQKQLAEPLNQPLAEPMLSPQPVQIQNTISPMTQVKRATPLIIRLSELSPMMATIWPSRMRPLLTPVFSQIPFKNGATSNKIQRRNSLKGRLTLEMSLPRPRLIKRSTLLSPPRIF